MSVRLQIAAHKSHGMVVRYNTTHNPEAANKYSDILSLSSYLPIYETPKQHKQTISTRFATHQIRSGEGVSIIHSTQNY